MDNQLDNNLIDFVDYRMCRLIELALDNEADYLYEEWSMFLDQYRRGAGYILFVNGSPYMLHFKQPTTQVPGGDSENNT